MGRPAAGLALLWFAGAAIYTTQAAMGWAKGMAYSFSVMFKFFGFQRAYLWDETIDLSRSLQVIAGTQTVLAFILLFFLGLGLRTRFRLR